MKKSITKNTYVFVESKDGNTMMPTNRVGKVYRLLKSGKAIIIRYIPFTIRLMYDTKTNILQDTCLGIDVGRTNIGVSVVRSDGTCLYLSQVKTRNKDIPMFMSDRKLFRRNSRQGERLRRKRRAKQNNTLSTHNPIVKKLPGCNKCVSMKHIKNSKIRFNNRTRKRGWLTPTATHLFRTYMSIIKHIKKLLKITKVCIEVNRFTFMLFSSTAFDNLNGISRISYKDIKDEISNIQNKKCILCGKRPIACYHHVSPRHEGGNDSIDNVVGLCEICHNNVHKDVRIKQKLDLLHTKQNKKYGALSVINQMMPRLLQELKLLFEDNAYLTYGHQTKHVRDMLGIDKTHENDAYCIAIQAFDLDICNINFIAPRVYEIVQFRRQNRSLISHITERLYKCGKVVVAKNRRKRFEQFDDSLHEWYVKMKNLYGEKEAKRLQSNLKVFKSKHCYYADPNRFLPGSIFKYDGKWYVLRCQHKCGTAYQAIGYGNKDFLSRKCEIKVNNRGLVYLI